MPTNPISEPKTSLSTPAEAGTEAAVRRAEYDELDLRIWSDGARVIAMTNNAAEEELDTRIRDRAYRIWIEEGQPDGKYLEHWLRAKREVEEEDKIINGTEELKQ